MKKSYNIWNVADLDLIISDYLRIFDIENQGWNVNEIIQLKNTLAEVIVKYKNHNGVPYVEYILESDFEQYASDYDDLRDIKELGRINGIVVYQRLDKEGQLDKLLNKMENINAFIDIENLLKEIIQDDEFGFDFTTKAQEGIYYIKILNDILLSGRVKEEFATRGGN